MSQEKLAELRKKHGQLVEIKSGKDVLAFKPATLEEYEDAQTRHTKGDAPGVVNRELCGRTLVYPEGDEGTALLDAVFARAPATATRVSNELQDMARGDVEVTVKKG
jgi:hypothetical protein